MTPQDAQLVLLKAFVATDELPREMTALLKLMVRTIEKEAGAKRK